MCKTFEHLLIEMVGISTIQMREIASLGIFKETWYRCAKWQGWVHLKRNDTDARNGKLGYI